MIMKKYTYSKINKLAIGNLVILGTVLVMSGCGKSELQKLIDEGKPIEIEVAVPLSEQQGTESSIIWEQLALLETNETLRDSWDDTLGITVTDTGKNGMLYVDVDGNNVNNNTLRMALHNREFAKLFEDENSMLELSAGAQNQYTDIEVDETEKAVYMAINGYFNLLPDATPNFSNPDSTLNRLEFMSMVMRAETPVSDITADSAFAAAVGNNDLNIYAQEVAENSYLDIESKSLNNMTANGTMTRAEAVYLLMSRYFADELANVDISKAQLADAKDGGDFIEKAQSMSKEDITSKDYLKSYVLTYVITNPDEGVPTDLYKALVLAESKGIITSETRFDEGITKSEAVEMLVETLMQETGIQTFNAKQGTVEGYVAETEDTTPVETETREGTVGDPSQMDIETPESKPTPENITPQSSVEDMIAAYPDEITPELQAKLDSITNYYEQDLLPEEFYKEDIYNTLYGPSQEELQAELERLLQGATSGSTQNSETEIPDALKALESHGSNSGKDYDPNYQVSDNLKGAQCY